MLRVRAISAALLMLGVVACRSGVHSHVEQPYPRKLSAWGLFEGRMAELKPSRGVVPYDLNTPLFSDYASKYRFVWMPAGAAASYRRDEVFEFPRGTILSKTFAYPVEGQTGKQRLIETRLLVSGNSGWTPLPYVWNAAQTEAYLEVAAAPVTVTWNQRRMDYFIPNVNQCKECHESSKVVLPIGPKARNLNKDFAYAEGPSNQLAYWTKAGYLRGAPDGAQAPRAAVWDSSVDGSLEQRARAYLDVNCAHCHNPQGSANTSGLYLTMSETDPLRLGLCKVPVSAGLGSGNLLFDVVAGNPAESILVHRMDSDTPKVMMPELGRTLIHREGVALVREWIESMRGGCGVKGRPL